MKIKPLIAAFLSYLQFNNQQQGSVYPENWLQKQADDFNSTLYYAAKGASWVIRDEDSFSESMSNFIHDIHRNCSKTTYHIAKQAKNGERLQELSGQFRHIDVISPKETPIIDSNNQQDTVFFNHGKMPLFLDGRLQRMGVNPQSLSVSKKIKKMHGKPAWNSGNDVLQMASYIYAHVNEEESYYFLRAYYKKHYVVIDQSDDDKAMLFAAYLEKEIKAIGQRLGMRFKKNTVLTEREQTAYARVYVNYPAPHEIKGLFSAYMQQIAPIVRAFGVNNPEEIPSLIVDLVTNYIRIHPFFDANYRVISILTNAILAYHGYEFINFHDPDLKKAFNIPFNGITADNRKIIALLEKALVKNEHFSTGVSVSEKHLLQQCEVRQDIDEVQCEAELNPHPRKN